MLCPAPCWPQVNDLFDEEEVPAAAARGVSNLLMVYNTDLRALYDKYWCVILVLLWSAARQVLVRDFGITLECCTTSTGA